MQGLQGLAQRLEAVAGMQQSFAAGISKSLTSSRSLFWLSPGV